MHIDPFTQVVRPAPNRVDIVRFEPKGALMALKRVYLIKRSFYIYSINNFLPYPMWDMTNIPPPPPMQTQCPRCVPWDCEAKQTPLRDQTNPTPRSGGSNTICKTRSQSCRYCSFWTQRGPYGFKTHILG